VLFTAHGLDKNVTCTVHRNCYTSETHR